MSEHNASRHNSTKTPFSPHKDPAVGKVFSLYYSSWQEAQATSVEVLDTEGYVAATRTHEDVWEGNQILPTPACGLQLVSRTNYPSDERKANLRYSEIAVCEYLHFNNKVLPSCGADTAAGEVCQLTIWAPLPSDDKLQEPYIASSIALAAYSKICALGLSTYASDDVCKVHRSDVALCSSMKLVDNYIHLEGIHSPGRLDLKLDDAYLLNFLHVYLASADRDSFEKTRFNAATVLTFSHTPPSIHFCENFSCLVDALVR